MNYRTNFQINVFAPTKDCCSPLVYNILIIKMHGLLRNKVKITQQMLIITSLKRFTITLIFHFIHEA